MMHKKETGIAQSEASDNFTNKIWNDLDRNIWPDELAPIKPSKWDAMEPSLKGKVVLENLGNIIYHVSLLSKAKQQPTKPSKATHHKIDYIVDNILSTGHLYP